MKYDIIIVGAGPCGIFTALELKKNNPNKSILILEKGSSISKRICPKRKTGNCVNCSPCNITTGFAGAGAYSDGKLSLSPDVGGNLPEYIGYEKTQELIDYVDEIYLKFGADKKIYGIDNKEQIDEIRKKAIRSNLKLVECPIRHMGTEEGYNIYSKIETYLKEIGVELKFRNPVKDIILNNNRKVKGVIADKEYLADRVIICVGREGSDWLKNLCHKHDIDTETGDVDIGVRVETRNEIMEELNKAMYESKLIYYTPTFDDKVRTFCTNPGGEVSTEYYDDNLAVVNGHSYKSDDLKTKNTNFALLVTKHFTKPFNSPIEYGMHIAKLGNMLSGNKILVQRYGDFKKGRRTNEKRLYRNNIIPTLKDAVPGDLSLVLPHRLLKDIDEMIIALDNVAPGLASDETLLYGVEVKFYSNKVITNDNFETNIKNLYVGGDGAGITRGLMQASVNGVLLGRQFSK
ncbi:NAD(P)/FAD-dependent oxidoreductase [Anaerosalibacter bizertensis]|uniref:NAD(P)/FAD-dependent oxidoreductase n=1 Tax=Anaerosalibacter bizertensis TaxID=932217 RepID=UPI001D004E78|nr:NAD(P)-binding protein [Anaerosalibacter bizertensis]MCB5558932.1 FAD-dependent oxidoreductase [Anaerosalibacter bizertensis]